MFRKENLGAVKHLLTLRRPHNFSGRIPLPGCNIYTRKSPLHSATNLLEQPNPTPDTIRAHVN